MMCLTQLFLFSICFTEVLQLTKAANSNIVVALVLPSAIHTPPLTDDHVKRLSRLFQKVALFKTFCFFFSLPFLSQFLCPLVLQWNKSQQAIAELAKTCK